MTNFVAETVKCFELVNGISVIMPDGVGGKPPKITHTDAGIVIDMSGVKLQATLESIDERLRFYGLITT